jgi:hypothetical protein
LISLVQWRNGLRALGFLNPSAIVRTYSLNGDDVWVVQNGLGARFLSTELFKGGIMRRKSAPHTKKPTYEDDSGCIETHEDQAEPSTGGS